MHMTWLQYASIYKQAYVTSVFKIKFDKRSIVSVVYYILFKLFNSKRD